MRIISRQALEDFIKRHPGAKSRVERWYRLVKRNEFQNFNQVRGLFPHADAIGNFVVFNVGGNNYRIATFIDYRPKPNNIIFIRKIMTHSEYSKDSWKDDPWFSGG